MDDLPPDPSPNLHLFDGGRWKYRTVDGIDMEGTFGPLVVRFPEQVFNLNTRQWEPRGPQ